MSEQTERYLLEQQYKNADNLQARIQLHQRFGKKTTTDWQRWVFDHFHTPATSNVLELGCGPGNLWRNNTERIPATWNITLSDFSPGMLDAARASLNNVSHPFIFAQVDAQVIPFADTSFNMVIANHMLYHIPDRDKAIAEVRRVLKPQGRFYAATNGATNMQAMHEIIRRVAPSYSLDKRFNATFTLENGYEQLARHFTHIEQYRVKNTLVVTETAPLVAYILSTPARDVLEGDKLFELHELIEQEIALHGAVQLHTINVLFVASEL